MKQNIQPCPRITIRKQIKALLKLYVDINERVFDCRPNPFLLEQLPCVAFYLSEEPGNHNDTSPRVYTKECAFIIEILQAEPASLADAEAIGDFLDARSVEVEYALLHDIALELGEGGNFIEDVVLVSGTSVKQVYEGVTNISAYKMLFNIKYKYEVYDLRDIGEFKKFMNTMNLVDGGQSVDDVTIRT
jgi:hypothetical protein